MVPYLMQYIHWIKWLKFLCCFFRAVLGRTKKCCPTHSSLEFEITLKLISTYKLYTIFFLMTSALIWVHLLNDWKGRFGGLTPTGLAPPPIFGRKIVQFLHSQYLGQSQQKEKNIVLWWVSWRENSVFCFMHIGWKGAILVWELIIFGTKQQYL